MAPFKSTFVKSAGKLFGVFNQKDLSLRGEEQTDRVKIEYGSGGTREIPGDGYAYHMFLTSGAFVITQNLDVDWIVIAGGGSGGSGAGAEGGGGGGAGGYRTGTTEPLTPGEYTITVGDGGLYPEAQGGPSTFASYTSTGGGRGGLNPSGSNVGNPGGSGGGSRGAGSPKPGGSGIGGQGSNGGGCAHRYPGSGGGGKGGSGNNVGTGGAGSANPTWSIPPSYGTPGPTAGVRYFAGGGGGGPGSDGPHQGTGGYGGGGGTGGPATANTGGGGYGTSQPGGSGIVILRYLI